MSIKGVWEEGFQRERVALGFNVFPVVSKKAFPKSLLRSIYAKLRALRAANRPPCMQLFAEFLQGTLQDRQGFSKNHPPLPEQPPAPPKVHFEGKWRCFFRVMFFRVFAKKCPLAHATSLTAPETLAEPLQ